MRKLIHCIICCFDFLPIIVLGSNSRRLLIPNTERNVKAGYYVLENDGYEGVNSATDRAINVLDSSAGGIPRGSIYRGS
jgi:hypothetical protein